MRNLWTNLAAQLTATPAQSVAAFDCLTALYEYPSRAYHNLKHVENMLDEFNVMGLFATEPLLVQLAIWFHDCVYNPKANDNEARSAEVCRALLYPFPLNPIQADVVTQLILATKHAAAPATPDQRLIVDLDLAILGAAPEQYDAYAEAIRTEYRHMNEATFKVGRRHILQGFVARPTIFSTDAFIQKYEAPARENLLREIDQLAV